MSRLLKRYNAWRFRRQQLSLARFVEVRAKGKTRFVLHQAFFFAVLNTALRDVINQFYGDGGNLFSLGFYFVMNAVTGFFVGLAGWEHQEKNIKMLSSIVASRRPLTTACCLADGPRTTAT